MGLARHLTRKFEPGIVAAATNVASMGLARHLTRKPIAKSIIEEFTNKLQWGWPDI